MNDTECLRRAKLQCYFNMSLVLLRYSCIFFCPLCMKTVTLETHFNIDLVHPVMTEAD